MLFICLVQNNFIQNILIVKTFQKMFIITNLTSRFWAGCTGTAGGADAGQALQLGGGEAVDRALVGLGLDADQIVLLSGGRVVEMGSPAELLKKNGLFRHMAQLQSESMEWTA